MLDNAIVSLVLGSLLLFFVAVTQFITRKAHRYPRRVLMIFVMVLAGMLVYGNPRTYAAADEAQKSVAVPRPPW